jgi:hypothetical protein
MTTPTPDPLDDLDPDLAAAGLTADDYDFHEIAAIQARVAPSRDESTVADYSHWNEEAAYVQRAEQSSYDDADYEDWY